MNLNELILSAHSEMEHQRRWAVMRKVVNYNLGNVIFKVYDGSAYLCLSDTGVYAVVNTESTMIITAYLPTMSRARKLYGRVQQEVPNEITRMIRRNERREQKIMNNFS